MSDQNVENLRAFCAEWVLSSATRNPDTPDESFLDPDVIYQDTVLPDHVGETYHGREGVIRALERWAEPYEALTVELEEIVGTGDRLVSVHRIRAKARHTGIEFEAPGAYAWTFRGGKVARFQSFPDPTAALEAAGLPSS